EEDQIGRYQGQYERSQHRSQYPAPAADQTDPADHDGGQTAQRVVDPGERGADSRGHCQAEAADSAEKAGKDISREPRALDIDPAAKRGVAVASDGIEAKPQRRAPQGDPDDRD